MNSIKNKAWKRGASVALTITTSLWLSGAALVMPLAASADLISDLQAQIVALQAQLNALITASSGGTAMAGKCSFTRDLTVGVRGDDVKCLQDYLKGTGHYNFSGGSTGYFGSVSKVAAAAWQAANGVSPAVGYFGSISRAKYNSLVAGGTATTGGTTTTGTTVVVPSGSGLTVSPGVQPPEALAPINAARVPYTKVVFTASADGDITVRSLTVERQGVGSDSGLAGVVLLDENAIQMGIAKTLNTNHQANLTEVFTVKAGTSRTMTIAGNRSSTGNAGEILRLALVAVDAGSATVNGTLPIVGNGMTNNGTLTIGSVTMTRGPLDPNGDQSKEIGTVGYTLSSIKVTAGSAEKVYVYSTRWNQSGTAGATDIANVKTYVNGTAYDAVVSADGKYYTSVFGSGILVDKGSSVEIYVKGDLVGGSGRTVKMDVYRNTDLNVKGETYGFGLTPPTDGTSGLFGTTNPWYKGSTLTASNGTMTVSKAISVAAQNIAVNLSNQTLGGIEVEVKGEPISVAAITFRFSTSTIIGTTAQLTNATLVDSNGKVVAGPVDGSSVSLLAFSDTVTFPIGKTTYTLKGKLSSVYGNDAVISASTTPGDSAVWQTVTGQVTGNTITPTPASAVSMNTMTIKTAAIRLSVSLDPVAQTVVSGANQFKFATYQFDATASGEDIKFSNIPLEYNAISGATATNLTNCQLYDGSTSLTTGSNVVNPTTGSTAAASSTVFTFDGGGLTIPKGTIKSLTLNCNIAGGATGSYSWGYHAAANTLTPVGLVSANTLSSSQITENDSRGQTMALTANGTMTIVSDSSAPSYTIVSAGTTGNVAGVLKFHAASEAITLHKVALQLTNSASSSASDIVQVTLWDGGTQVGAATFSGSSAYATSTLSGSFVIPKDGDKLMTIKADLAQIGTSLPGGQGQLIAINYDGADSTGTQGVGVSSGVTIKQGSATDTAFPGLRMFKSYPRFAKLAVPTTTLVTATTDLYRFSVTASAQGSVGIFKFTVNISTSSSPESASTTVTNLKVLAYTDSGFSSTVSGFSTAGQLNTTISNLVKSGQTDVLMSGVSSGDAYLQIPAGATYYFRVVGDVTLTGGPTSGSVITNLQGDAAYPIAISVNDDMDTAAKIDASANTDDDFIWSPNATTTSGVAHTDWTNGYFVQGFPSDNMDSVSIVK